MNAEASLLVACLCAAWCSACREYRPVFEVMAVQFEGRAEFAWVDIEDEADRLGELDVDNFPTLLLARGDELLFLGPVLPLASTAARLLRSAIAGELVAELAHDGTTGAPPDLVARVRAIVGNRTDAPGKG